MNRDCEIEEEFSTEELKLVMAQFATGVMIVTAFEEGVPVGFTCQSFVSLLLTPLLVALARVKTPTTWPKIARAQTFCVNILSAAQKDVCLAFGSQSSAGYRRMGERLFGLSVPWNVSMRATTNLFSAVCLQLTTVRARLSCISEVNCPLLTLRAEPAQRISGMSASCKHTLSMETPDVARVVSQFAMSSRTFSTRGTFIFCRGISHDMY